MKKKTINSTNEKELVKTLVEKRAALRTFRFAISGGKTKNIREGRVIRKEIAQIMTALVAAKKLAVAKK